jgi:hypothetical protein
MGSNFLVGLMGGMHLIQPSCCNLNLRFATKVKACKVAGQEKRLGVTPHAFGSVRKCEGMNIHIPKGVSILELES